MKNPWITIIELGRFPEKASSLLSEKEHFELITSLANSPFQGDEITGTGGLRKLRWGSKGKGKRAGVRVIYYFYNETAPLFLLGIYGKNEQVDLKPSEKKQLTQLAQVLKAECKKCGEK